MRGRFPNLNCCCRMGIFYLILGIQVTLSARVGVHYTPCSSVLGPVAALLPQDSQAFPTPACSLCGCAGLGSSSDPAQGCGEKGCVSPSVYACVCRLPRNPRAKGAAARRSVFPAARSDAARRAGALWVPGCRRCSFRRVLLKWRPEAAVAGAVGSLRGLAGGAGGELASSPPFRCHPAVPPALPPAPPLNTPLASRAAMATPDQKSPNVLLQNLCCRILGKSEGNGSFLPPAADKATGSGVGGKGMRRGGCARPAGRGDAGGLGRR